MRLMNEEASQIIKFTETQIWKNKLATLGGFRLGCFKFFLFFDFFFHHDSHLFLRYSPLLTTVSKVSELFNIIDLRANYKNLF